MITAQVTSEVVAPLGEGKEQSEQACGYDDQALERCR
jgi:hypothetical protein